jgi:hypothetical protein
MTRPRKSTLIRNARKATAARKRAAFEFQTPNKKPGIAPGLYTFDAAGAPQNAPVATYPHSPIRSMNDEICR